MEHPFSATFSESSLVGYLRKKYGPTASKSITKFSSPAVNSNIRLKSKEVVGDNRFSPEEDSLNAVDLNDEDGVENKERRDYMDAEHRESITRGGKMFIEWLKKRINEDATVSGNSNGVNPSNMIAPTNPQEIARRKAVGDITSTMLKKNPRLKPGGTDANTVANLTSTDPQLAKADPKIQQAVSSFFLQQ